MDVKAVFLSRYGFSTGRGRDDFWLAHFAMLSTQLRETGLSQEFQKQEHVEPGGNRILLMPLFLTSFLSLLVACIVYSILSTNSFYKADF